MKFDMAVRWLGWAQSPSKARLDWVRRHAYGWLMRDKP